MVQMFRLETHQYLLTINAPEFCTVDGTDRICCLLTDRGEIVGALRPFPAIYLCKLFFPTRPIPLTTTYLHNSSLLLLNEKPRQYKTIIVSADMCCSTSVLGWECGVCLASGFSMSNVVSLDTPWSLFKFPPLRHFTLVDLRTPLCATSFVYLYYTPLSKLSYNLLADRYAFHPYVPLLIFHLASFKRILIHPLAVLPYGRGAPDAFPSYARLWLGKTCFCDI